MQRSYGRKTSFKSYGQPQGYSQGQRSYQAPAPRPKFNSSQEQKADYGKVVKQLTAEYFMRGVRLAVLPGGFPVCFAVGRALVTDYEVWNDFKDACQAKAETAAKVEVYNADAAPFSWGIRPISPVRLHSLSNPETCYWLWDWVLMNIAPYQPARAALAKGLRGIESPFSAEITAACRAGAWPSDESLLWFASTVNTETAITPGQLAETFKSQDGGSEFANLAELQVTDDKVRATKAAAQRTVSRMQAIETEDEGEMPPQPRPPQGEGFISDSDDDI